MNRRMYGAKCTYYRYGGRESVRRRGISGPPGSQTVQRHHRVNNTTPHKFCSSYPPDTLSHASGVEQYETAGHKSRVYARVTSARRRSRPDKLPFSFPPPPPVKATPESEQLLHHRLQRSHRQLHVSTTTVNHQR